MQAVQSMHRLFFCIKTIKNFHLSVVFYYFSTVFHFFTIQFTKKSVIILL